MHIQFNSDNQTPLGATDAEQIESAVGAKLERIADRVTRVEVHVSDINGPRRGAGDKRCMIEIRPNGMGPISATDQAPTIQGAVSGAAEKVLTAFERQVGKATTRKGY
ncbi:MAG TPA: HPF/RaiA family ribosome-associated protein [Sphingomicrobium sp.]|jgi:ribosome-associated translation inhibitor RaiA|nr:HPF/RaiA family ribosome-associated protein [Sphingomicrobium sp.]